ncbi:hypothetical protein PG987_004356 [Apiospora arundinis]
MSWDIITGEPWDQVSFSPAPAPHARSSVQSAARPAAAQSATQSVCLSACLDPAPQFQQLDQKAVSGDLTLSYFFKLPTYFTYRRVDPRHQHLPTSTSPTYLPTYPPVPSQLLIPSQTFLVTPTAPFDKASSKLLSVPQPSFQLQDSDKNLVIQPPMRNLHDTWAQAVVVAVTAAPAAAAVN